LINPMQAITKVGKLPPPGSIIPRKKAQIWPNKLSIW
jgi:hypothetical protein